MYLWCQCPSGPCRVWGRVEGAVGSPGIGWEPPLPAGGGSLGKGDTTRDKRRAGCIEGRREVPTAVGVCVERSAGLSAAWDAGDRSQVGRPGWLLGEAALPPGPAACQLCV